MSLTQESLSYEHAKLQTKTIQRCYAINSNDWLHSLCWYICCAGAMMIDQELIDTVSAHLEIGDLKNNLAKELLANYIALIEQNAELHKELTKFKSQNFKFNGGIKCSDVPGNLAM